MNRIMRRDTKKFSVNRNFIEDTLPAVRIPGATNHRHAGPASFEDARSLGLRRAARNWTKVVNSGSWREGYTPCPEGQQGFRSGKLQATGRSPEEQTSVPIKF